ncbi:hypothetical protein [Neptunicella sp. SCSIO 80796]|uniref:hypothetical protein n=1 Tax=Neptunicella plasticusilytica TaxID=3117012 RepID=UPI003A4D8586
MSQQLKCIFKLSYNSTSTEDNTIDATVLGNSLINMSALIKESTKVLHGEESTARVEVQAHEPGSFVVEFAAWLDAGGADVLQTLGIVTTGAAVSIGNVFAALKALKNRTPVSKFVEGDTTKIIFDDGESISIATKTDKLISNYSVRQRLDQVVKKAAEYEDGATVTFLTEDDEVIEQVTPEQIEFFKAPPRKILAQELTEVDTTNVIFTVVALESKKGWKIRLANGEEVSATMNDDSFIERINNRKREFLKGDMFEIKLKTITRELDGKSSISRSIEEVIRHRVDKSRKVI